MKMWIKYNVTVIEKFPSFSIFTKFDKILGFKTFSSHFVWNIIFIGYKGIQLLLELVCRNEIVDRLKETSLYLISVAMTR